MACKILFMTMEQYQHKTAVYIPVPCSIDTEMEVLTHHCSSQVVAGKAEPPLWMRPDHPSPAVTELTTESHLDPWVTVVHQGGWKMSPLTRKLPPHIPLTAELASPLGQYSPDPPVSSSLVPKFKVELLLLAICVSPGTVCL